MREIEVKYIVSIRDMSRLKNAVERYVLEKGGLEVKLGYCKDIYYKKDGLPNIRYRVDSHRKEEYTIKIKDKDTIFDRKEVNLDINSHKEDSAHNLLTLIGYEPFITINKTRMRIIYLKDAIISYGFIQELQAYCFEIETKERDISTEEGNKIINKYEKIFKLNRKDSSEFSLLDLCMFEQSVKGV